MSSPACDSFFSCDDARKHLTLEQVLKMMIIEDENGCPVLKTSQTTAPGTSTEEVFESDILATDTSPGTITAGYWSVTFETSDDFEGTINGVTRQPSRSITIKAKENNTLPEIPWTITTGTITVDKLSN